MIRGILVFIVLTFVFAFIGAVWSTLDKSERISSIKFMLKCMALSALSVLTLSFIVILF